MPEIEMPENLPPGLRAQMAQINAMETPQAPAQAPVAPPPPVQQPAPQPPVQEPAPAPPADVSELLRKSEARYSSLQGKYNSEVRSLTDKVRELEDKLQAQEKAKSSEDMLASIRAKVNERLGADQIDVVGKDFVDSAVQAGYTGAEAARDMIDKELAKLREQQAAFAANQQKFQLTMFLNDIASELGIPAAKLQEIDTSEVFDEWTATHTDDDGEGLKDRLNGYFGKGNVRGAARVYRRYLSALGQSSNEIAPSVSVPASTTVGAPAKAVTLADLKAVERRIATGDRSPEAMQEYERIYAQLASQPGR